VSLGTAAGITDRLFGSPRGIIRAAEGGRAA